MKSRLKLIYGLVFVATNVMATSTITVCTGDGTQCKAADDLESLKILPSGSDGSSVKVFSNKLYSKVSGGITPTKPPVTKPPVNPGECPTPLLSQKFINYPIGSNTQFPGMLQGEVLVIKLVPPTNHTGKIFWGPAVGTQQVTSKLGVISTCPGVINSNVNNETLFPCRRSRNEDSLWYSTETDPSFDQCRLKAGATYYVNIFSGHDLRIDTADVDNFNSCPSGKRCDITLNVK